MKWILCILVMASTVPAHAYFQMDLIKAKKSNKEATQWTLFDWMAQKNRISLMDSWLAANSQVNFVELNMGGGYNRFKLKTETGTTTARVDENSQSYHLDLYIAFLNLNGEYERTDNSREAYGGAVGLRLLGASSQTTNLVARYGWRKTHHLKTLENWENQYAEGQLQLYLVKQFGLQGKYRYYFPNESNKGTRLEGHRVTAGAFLEFLIFRVYGDYYQEPMQYNSSGVVTKEERSGFEGGVRLFF